MQLPDSDQADRAYRSHQPRGQRRNNKLVAFLVFADY